MAALANIAIWDAPTPVLADLAWPTLALVFAVRFINPLDGPLGEEPGWRGYALPQLQTGRAPLGAAFILGLLVALWHVPLVMTGQLAETQHPNGQLPQLPLSARYRAARSAVWDCSS